MPLKTPCVLYMTTDIKRQERMFLQLFGGGRLPKVIQILWRGTQNPETLEKLHGDQVGILEFSSAQCDVDRFLKEVQDPISQ